MFPGRPLTRRFAWNLEHLSPFPAPLRPVSLGEQKLTRCYRTRLAAGVRVSVSEADGDGWEGWAAGELF